MRRLSVCLLVVSAALSACGSYDEPQPLAAGFTPCNDQPGGRDGVVCQPNQYCAEPKLHWCFRGCLSDDNCSLEQICTKDRGADVGSCTAIDDLRDRSPDLEPGYTECGDPASNDDYAICQPSQYCSGYKWGICSSGCLSEDNCTENQACEKYEGENTGVCVGLN